MVKQKKSKLDDYSLINRQCDYCGSVTMKVKAGSTGCKCYYCFLKVRPIEECEDIFGNKLKTNIDVKDE